MHEKDNVIKKFNFENEDKSLALLCNERRTKYQKRIIKV